MSKIFHDPAKPSNGLGNRGMLGAWQTGELPAPPPGGWQTWKALLGPGVLLAGASVGSGEWLSGPAVSAQYGGTLLWVATLSIVAQVFCNLEMMRYTLYCGEPIVVGPGDLEHSSAQLATILGEIVAGDDGDRREALLLSQPQASCKIA